MINDEELISNFKSNFNFNPTDIFVSFGRLEIVGNHTDHNNGKCLVATCDLSIRACCSKSDSNIIRIVSKGFEPFEINLNDLSQKKEECGTSTALVKGVCFFCKEKGFNIGGFNAYIESDIPQGTGVSSSAAFELLISEIVSYYFNKDKISKIEKAKISQLSEREYFGKPCGLLDQIGASFGGINYVDFKSLKHVKVKTTSYPFDDEIYLINSGGSHENLTPLYAAIPEDMKNAAKKIGNKNTLRSISISKFRKYLNSNKNTLTDIEKTRTEHFFTENERVKKGFDSCKHKNEIEFLSSVRESGISSCNKLKNAMVEGEYEESPQKLIDLFNENFKNSACKVHGGGFKGTIICFISKKDKKAFEENYKNIFVNKSIVKVNISPKGASHFSSLN